MGLGAMLLAPRVAAAGTCTVSSMKVLIKGANDLTGTVGVQGLQIPTTVDDAAGTISLDLSGFPLTHFVIVGVDSELSFPQNAVYSGTIDAGGNVSIGGVEMDFLAHLGDPPIAVTGVITLATGISAVTIAGADYPTEGELLVPSTGVVTLRGAVVIPDAPNAGGPIGTGLEIICTLDPIPSMSALPKAPSLRASGKGKVGKAPAPTDTAVPGDSLTLHLTLTKGAQALDPATSDVFVRIRDAGGTETTLLRVPAGALTAKGKALSASDSDGSKVHVLVGRKRAVGLDAAPLSGSIIMKGSKKAFKVTLKESALDLSAVPAGAATVTLGIGTVTASDAVTVVKKGSKVVLK